MKFICLGYADTGVLDSLSEGERAALVDRCLLYDEELRRGGHFLGGEALQPPQRSVTLKLCNGQPVTTDGPFAETKEYLGGILMLGARDLNHAIQLMSRHPGLRFGRFEIRPVDEEFVKFMEHRISELRESQSPGPDS